MVSLVVLLGPGTQGAGTGFLLVGRGGSDEEANAA